MTIQNDINNPPNNVAITGGSISGISVFNPGPLTNSQFFFQDAAQTAQFTFRLGAATGFEIRRLDENVGVTYIDFASNPSSDFNARIWLNASGSELSLDGDSASRIRSRRPLTIDSSLTIAGLQEFRQSAKPTARADGTAIQTGDRWYSTGDRDWFYWTGSFWASEQLHYWECSGNGTAGPLNIGLIPRPNFNILFVGWRVYIVTYGVTHDATNHFDFAIYRTNNLNVNTDEVTSSSEGQITSGGNALITPSINFSRDVSALNIRYWGIWTAVTGSATGTVQSLVSYRLLKI